MVRSCKRAVILRNHREINLEVQSFPTYLPDMGYHGSKGGNGTWQQILSRIPKCDLFIEAMAGSGILSSKITPDLCSTVTNDLERSCKSDLHLDYTAVIDKYDCATGLTVTFYFDPPYMFSTRKSQRKVYKIEWSENDHDAFLARVLTVKSNCMISHYPCSKYDLALQSWRSVTYASMTRKGLAAEKLWLNYPEPKVLLMPNKVGSDCWQRQAINRKIKRLISKLSQLEQAESAAIITGLYNHFLKGEKGL